MRSGAEGSVSCKAIMNMQSLPAGLQVAPQPPEHRLLDDTQPRFVQPTESSNRTCRGIRGQTLGQERAVFQEGNRNLHLKFGSSQRCGVEHYRDQRAVDLPEWNAQ